MTVNGYILFLCVNLLRFIISVMYALRHKYHQWYHIICTINIPRVAHSNKDFIVYKFINSLTIVILNLLWVGSYIV